MIAKGAEDHAIDLDAQIGAEAHGFGGRATGSIHLSGPCVRRGKHRVGVVDVRCLGAGALKYLDRTLWLVVQKKGHSRDNAVTGRQARVQPHRPLDRGDRVGMAAAEGQDEAEGRVRLCVARAQCHSPLGGRQRLLMAAIDDLQDGEHGERQRRLGVDLERSARMLIGPLARHWPRQHVVVVAAHDDSRGPRIGGKRLGKGRVERRRLLVEA